MSKGGYRLGSGAKSNWHHPETKTIRVPTALSKEILKAARMLDNGYSLKNIVSLPSETVTQYSERERGATVSSRSLDSSQQYRVDGCPSFSELGLGTDSCTIKLPSVAVKKLNDIEYVLLSDLTQLGYTIKLL